MTDVELPFTLEIKISAIDLGKAQEILTWIADEVDLSALAQIERLTICRKPPYALI